MTSTPVQTTPVSTPDKYSPDGSVFDRLSKAETKAFSKQKWHVWKAYEETLVNPPKQFGKDSPILKSPLPRVATLSLSPNKIYNPHGHRNGDSNGTKPHNSTPRSKTVLPKKPKAPVYAPPSAVDQNITVPPHDELMKLFHRMDPNGNGILSLAELDKAIVELYPSWNNKPAIMAAYKAADKNGDGFVKRNEFAFFLRYIQYYNNLWHLFASIDTDQDRRIDRGEFTQASTFFLTDGEHDAGAVFDEIDENHGGFILFDELCEWMAKNKADWNDQDVELETASPTSSKKSTKNRRPKTPAAAMRFPVPPKEEALELFDQWDPNGNGLLSLAELDKAIVESHPDFNNKPAIMAAYKASDRNNDGFVKRHEFFFFLKFIQYYNDLYKVFSTMDTSHDRRISLDEFIEAAPMLQLHSRDPKEIFQEIDTNHGGFILFDEFCAYQANMDDAGTS